MLIISINTMILIIAIQNVAPEHDFGHGQYIMFASSYNVLVRGPSKWTLSIKIDILSE